MADNDLYKFCWLSRKIGGQEFITHSWLPEQFAVQGKYLELLNNGKWENGWHVDSASTDTQKEHQIVRYRTFDSLKDKDRAITARRDDHWGW